MKHDQIRKLSQILKARRTPIAIRVLADELDCTIRTVQRYLDDLRDIYHAPLDHLPGKGWILDQKTSPNWEIPGLWLSEQDIQSMLLLLSILKRFGNGLMRRELKSVEQLINNALAQHNISRSQIDQRIKIIPLANAVTPNKHLYCFFNAIINRQQITLDYCDYQQQHSHRIISPQRLIYYRDNWLCDAWCHRRNALRTFSLARVEETELMKAKAKNIPNAQMDDYYSSGYGMFSGKTKHKATLRFFPAIAREIAKQQWHPQQHGEWHGNDYLLTLPYSDQRELVQDILRHSPNVIVESPSRLKNAVKRQLHMALEVYDEI